MPKKDEDKNTGTAGMNQIEAPDSGEGVSTHVVDKPEIKLEDLEAMLADLRSIGGGGKYTARMTKMAKQLVKSAKKGDLNYGLLNSLIKETESRFGEADREGHLNKQRKLSGVLENMYKLSGDEEKMRGFEDWQAGKGTPDFLGGDYTGYQTETGTTGGEDGGEDGGEGGEDGFETGYDDLPDAVKEEWRNLGLPESALIDLVKKKGGEVMLQLMSLSSALEGRAAAVDELREFEEKVEGTLGKPVLTEQDQKEMLAKASGDLAKSYENQRVAQSQFLGARGISPESGVAQELGAAMRLASLSKASDQRIQTNLDVKQLNRAAVERALGLSAGIQGAKANIMAGFPGDLAQSAAATISAAYYEPPEPSGFDQAMQAVNATGNLASGVGALAL